MTSKRRLSATINHSEPELTEIICLNSSIKVRSGNIFILFSGGALFKSSIKKSPGRSLKYLSTKILCAPRKTPRKYFSQIVQALVMFFNKSRDINLGHIKEIFTKKNPPLFHWS